MRSCILLLVLALPTLAAEEGFTEAELEKVQAYTSLVRNLCREEVRKTVSNPDYAPSVSQWMTDVMTSSDYCECSARRFAENITPAILHAADVEQRVSLVERSGAECMVPLFQSAFPAFCHDVAGEMVKKRALDPSVGKVFCQCVQTDVDAITVDSYKSFVSGTALRTTMKRCGLDKLEEQD